MSEKVPSASNNGVSLGCGTLILIAVIVLIFSGGPKVDELKVEVSQLRQDVQRLETKIDTLTGAVESLGGTVEAAPDPAAAP